MDRIVLLIASGVVASLVSVGVSAQQPETSSPWITASERSAMDDSRTEILSTFSLHPAPSRFGRAETYPDLTVRCLERQLAVFVDLGQYISVDFGNGYPVRYRIDDRPLVSTRWRISTSHEAIGRWREAGPLVRELLDARRFIFEVTPHGRNPVTLEFNITGLRDVIRPAAEACRWQVPPPRPAQAPAARPPAPATPR